MNRNEYAALFEDVHVSDRERTLYLYLRWHMDYDSGITGVARKVSYQSIREHLEYKPERGSKEPAYYPTKDQVKRLLRKIESYGWVQSLHSGKRGEAMVFRLVLASAGKIRPNEERHMSATVGAPLSPPQENPVNISARGDMSATINTRGAPHHERHTSDTSDIEQREIAREADFDAPSGRDLAFDKSFEAIAFRRYGNNKHLIENEFESFRLHKSHRTTRRTASDWQDEWRRWIARSNIMNPTPTTQRGNSHAATQHHTAAVLDVCEKYTAGQQPVTDYDDTHD